MTASQSRSSILKIILSRKIPALLMTKSTLPNLFMMKQEPLEQTFLPLHNRSTGNG